MTDETRAKLLDRGDMGVGSRTCPYCDLDTQKYAFRRLDQSRRDDGAHQGPDVCNAGLRAAAERPMDPAESRDTVYRLAQGRDFQSDQDEAVQNGRSSKRVSEFAEWIVSGALISCVVWALVILAVVL